ncbi:TPR repeat-containing protein [Kalymmatonema gypsitolerans NIES-4073]|nr:TPR repeat-containing protein [Scytonema sp. NIES-4073]
MKELQRYEEAIFSYEKAIELKPDYYVAWVNKGGTLKKLQRYEEAIFSCEKAIELKPDYSRAWYNRACYYALQGNIDLANENLKQAIKLGLGKCRERAKGDSDFDAIREDECFKKIINE